MNLHFFNVPDPVGFYKSLAQNKKQSNIMGGLINFVLNTPLRLNEIDDANMMQGPNRRLYFNTSIGKIKRWGQYKNELALAHCS